MEAVVLPASFIFPQDKPPLREIGVDTRRLLGVPPMILTLELCPRGFLAESGRIGLGFAPYVAPCSAANCSCSFLSS